MNSREERLLQFFAGYFNQDWDIAGASTWRDVVGVFVSENTEEHVAAVRDDLRSWLRMTDGGILKEWRCDYDPRVEGLSERAWLHAIADVIEDHLRLKE